MRSLKNKIIVITGASRGIGREMALRFAKETCKIAILGKTETPHPKLEGTIHSVAEEVLALGSEPLPIAVDIRNEDAVFNAIDLITKTWGGIDVLINNASALNIQTTDTISMKQFDLIQSVNGRGTFVCTKACLPHLKKSQEADILTLSPPLNLNSKWVGKCLAYTLSKYSMSLCTLGFAKEFKKEQIRANSLWPKTTIQTAAVKYNLPDAVYQASRKPSIMSDAAMLILTNNDPEQTGNCFVDEDILIAHGHTNLDHYAINPNQPLFPDIFLD